MIVTDPMLVKLGLVKQVTDSLDADGIDYVVFSEVIPDPSLTEVESRLALYRSNNADSIIALGGGSSIDCAKAIAACHITNKTPKKIAGKLKVGKPMPPFIARSATWRLLLYPTRPSERRYPAPCVGVIPRQSTAAAS